MNRARARAVSGGSRVWALRLAMVAVVGALAVWIGWRWHGTDATDAHEATGGRPASAVALRGGPLAAEEDDGAVSLSGVVVSAGTGVPVPRAEVLITPWGPQLNPTRQDAAVRRPKVARTDGRGRWNLDELSPGDHILSATAAGVRSVVPVVVTLVSGTPHEDVVLEVTEAGHPLRGEVLDVGGGPVAGALVSLTPLEGVHLDAVSLARWATRTGDDGRYALWVPEGAGRVDVTHPDYVAWSGHLAVPPGGTVRDVSLMPGGSISGVVVRAADGRPVIGAEVSVVGPEAGDRSSRRMGMDALMTNDAARTGPGGQFRVTGLSPGIHEITARAPGLATAGVVEVPLAVAEEVVGVELSVTPARTITGRVVLKGTSPPQPLAGVAVVAMPRSAKVRLHASALSSPDGRFVIEGVSPNIYYLAAKAEELVGSVSEVSVTIRDEDVADVVLALDPGVMLSGRVVPATATRLSLETSEAHATGLGLNAVVTSNKRVQGRSEPDGTFRLGPVPRDNEVTVVAVAEDGATGRLPVVIADEDLTDLVLALETQGGVVGRVVDGAGVPVVGVVVDVMPAQRAAVIKSSGATLGDRRVTASDGSFSRLGLVPGDYDLLVRAGEHFALAWHGVEQDEARRARSITVERGAPVELELVVARDEGVIEGRVIDAQGRPVSDALVHALPRATDAEFRRLEGTRSGAALPSSTEDRRHAFRMFPTPGVLSDVDGAFRIEGLSASFYDVIAESTTGEARGTLEEVATGSRVDVTIEDLHTIACAVTEAGEPVTSYTVHVARSGPHVLHERRTTVSEPSGRFEMGRLAAGTYEVKVLTSGGMGSSTVEAGPGPPQDCRIGIERFGAVQGVLIDSVTRAPVPGITPIVLGHSQDREALAAALISDSGPITGDDGSFRIEGLSPGQVQLEFMDRTAHWPFVSRAFGILEPGGTLDFGTVTTWRGEPVADTEQGSLGMSLVAWMDPVYKEAYDGASGGAAPPGVVPLVVGVTKVYPEGPAAGAGVREGDLIVAIDGVPVQSIGVFAATMMLGANASAAVAIGQTFTLTLRRADTDVEVTLTAVAHG